MQNDPVFPAPFKISGRNYWRLGDLRRYEAELAGIVHEPQPDDENFVQTNVVKKRYGGVSDMTLWRWLTKHASADN